MERKDKISEGQIINQIELPLLPLFPVAAFLIVDAKGIIQQCSDEVKAWFRTREEIIGTDLFLIPQNNWLEVALKTADTMKGQAVSGKLHLPFQPEGLPVSVYLVKCGITPGETGSCFCFIQRLDREFAIGPSENLDYNRLKIILENTGDIVSLHSLDGSFDYMSPSVEKVLGYPAEELIALGPFHAVHPDDLPIIKDVLEKIKQGQNSVKAKYRLIHKNGYEVWVDSISQCSLDAQGKPDMITVVTRDINASKLLEDSLRRSEERYRSLITYLPTGILLIDTAGNILETNQALLDILGSPGVESTKSINMFGFENLVNAGISEDLLTCLRDRKIVNGQAEYVSKWGKKSFLLYSAVPVFDQSGNVIQIICNVRDITRIKRAEEKSQQQIDFLNVVINTMQEPFFVKDENHRWIMLNDAAVAMMGQPREKLIGKSDYELYPKEQADVFWEKDKYVFQQGSNVNEEKITWSDGRERIIITYKRLYTEGNTGKKYIVGTIHDITDIKKSEARLQESESKYHDLFDNANDHIFTTDLNGNFTNANKVMLDTIGVSINEIGKYSIYSFCKPEVLEEARRNTDQLMVNGRVGPFEIETLERDGKSTFLEIQARVMFEDGKPVGIQGIARDISEKKQASMRLEQMNKELQELNASKDKFYSIIAHDLKNPFNSLIGFSELLLEEFDELSKEEMRDYVGIIRNTAKNSLILLENLLAWSRLQTGRMIYNPVPLNLAKEVDAAVTILYSLSYRKKIHVENVIDRSLIVKADQNMFLSIMHNLLMNAIKFTPSNGSILIKAEVEEQPAGNFSVRVSVTDTGVGISEEDQAKLFSLTRPFTLPGTEKETGTGLGLLLTREMVEKHGGSLKIESAVGAGSTFSFPLPLFVP
jgi:PAS domain S-box-containing protein